MGQACLDSGCKGLVAIRDVVVKRCNKGIPALKPSTCLELQVKTELAQWNNRFMCYEEVSVHGLENIINPPKIVNCFEHL